MKKLLISISIFIFSFSVCQAQDTIAFRSGKKIVARVDSVGKLKVVYVQPPDPVKKIVSTWRLKYIRYPGGTILTFNEHAPKKKYGNDATTECYLSIGGGYSVPSMNYRDAIVGNMLGASLTYYVYNHLGIVATAGIDLNATGLNYISDNYWGGFYIFQQYMAGVTYRTGGKPGYPWVDVIGLCGLANVTSPVTESGTGNKGITVNTPGNGTGIGFYGGLAFTNSANHFCSITFGIGCFGGVYNYPGNSSTFTKFDQATAITTTTVSKSVLKTSLILPEAYLAINFRLKKPGNRAGGRFRR